MKILIADDHDLLVEAVQVKLAQLGPGIDFLRAARVDQLLLLAASEAPDLALVDLGMPDAHGYEHIAELCRSYPLMRLIVLSGVDDPEVMRAILDLGAMGFIPKAYSSEVMLSAVRLVLAGGVYVPPMLLGALARKSPSADATMEIVTLENLRHLLTERQVDVLRLLLLGKPNKLISRELGISEGTVKIHLAAIFRALKVRNRTEAVVAARGLGEL
ncbi:response regulator transcription factor [Azotobacter chroococcum]|nr:response regulator transcription factor [Azotobacter chroococcum]